MTIALIAALAPDGTIGNGGTIPWHISEDLKRFKRLTMGSPVIMGRKTWESIGKPLPGRTNIVLTRNPDFHAPDGVRTFGDLEAALGFCLEQRAPMAFIIGGAELYRQSIDRANRLLLTRVNQEIHGDVKFPEYDRSLWREVSRQEAADHTFIEYTRCHP